jgi:polyhydroxybutyrate depolymerase
MKNIIALSILLHSFFADAQQTLNLTFQHGGLTREYTLYIPAIYTGSIPVPLIFNLHGYTSNKDQQLLYGDFRPIADTANFIMCLPNGTYDISNNRFWNAGFGGSVDDIGFIMALTDHLLVTYNIDSTRIYSTGMSNGGFMSYTLACARADRIAAIASVTGGFTPLQYASCNPSRPVSVMQIHGTADATVPYNGNVQFVAVDTLIKYWVNHNGCPSQPMVTPVPNTNTSDGCTATRYDYQSCSANTEVVFYKIDGGGHSWPGAIFNINITNMDFSASLEIWKFFRRFSNPVSSTAVAEKNISHNFKLFPNPSNNLLIVSISDFADNFSIEIFDLSGKLMFNGFLTNETTIDISSFNSGIYFVSLKSNSDIISKKFIKE